MFAEQPWRRAAPAISSSRCGKGIVAAVKALIKASGTLALDWWAGFFRRPDTPPGAQLAQTSDLFQRRRILDGYTSFVVGGLNSGNAILVLLRRPIGWGCLRDCGLRLRPRRGYQEW